MKPLRRNDILLIRKTNSLRIQQEINLSKTEMQHDELVSNEELKIEEEE
jgi:hypothetical protein